MELIGVPNWEECEALVKSTVNVYEWSPSGATEGAIDASNILKPSLARGGNMRQSILTFYSKVRFCGQNGRFQT